MFARRIPQADLVQFCRVLRHSLGAGVSLLRVMEQQSERGPPSLRAMCVRLRLALREGTNLSDAFEREKDLFPPLFLALIQVGEETGNLPETFRELEQYFLLEHQLRSRFYSQTIPTVLQFGLGVLVMAGVIYVMGIIGDTKKPLFTFFGLTGGPGAAAFLGSVCGVIYTIWLAFSLLRKTLHEQATADRALLEVPVLGPCLRAVAMSRFTLALQLTLDSGLNIKRALRLSLRATANSAFAVQADAVAMALKSGQMLHESLAVSRLFSEEFLNIVASAEEAGRVPEMMRHQVEYYQEETVRRLTALTRAATGFVWLVYAGFAIFAIFRFANIYFDALAGK